jgi:curved DNA-binding protein CbpA
MNAKDPKGYYAILGVSVDADAATIKAAYRRRAMELHPDRNTSPNAARQFQLINEAYATLNDPAARGEYDTMSLDTAKESAAPTSQKPEPIVCSCCGKVSAQPRYAIFLR